METLKVDSNIYNFPIQNSTFYSFDNLTISEENSLFEHIKLYSSKPDTSSSISNFEEVRSVFENHELKAINKENIKIKTHNLDWIFLILILSLVLFSALQSFFRKRMMQVYRSIFQNNFINQIEREGNILRETISIPLNIIQFTIIPLFIYQSLFFTNSLSGNYANIKTYLIIILIYAIICLIEVFTIEILGKIFKNEPFARLNKLNIIIFNQLTAIFLIPISILLLIWKIEIFIYIGIIISVLMFILRLIRIFFSGISQSNYSLLHLFMYLCTLEILPILLIIKSFEIYIS